MKARIATVGVVLAGAVLAAASPASAQTVKLEFRDGRVNLSTQNAPIRAILSEWTRLGGTTIINGDRLTGAPLTLELAGVTERQAVDILLRGAAGYMAGPRAASSVGASTFGSILILPTSSAVARPTTVAQVQPPPRPIIPDPGDVGLDVDDIDNIPEPGPDAREAAREAAEEARRRITDRRAQIFIGEQTIEQQQQQQPATRPGQPTAPAPSNPFGISSGSIRPGVITAPPPPADNRRRPTDN